MKAYKKVLFPEAKKAELVEDVIDEQLIPSGNFLLKTIYSQISAGTETACYRGVEAWFKLPNTPGYSCVGEVVGKADDVTEVEVGDIVFCRGKHAKLQYYPVSGNFCRLPDGMDPFYAPIARLFAIAMTGVRMSKIELGDDVLVIGLGLIGNAASQLAALQGANVCAMDLSDERRELAEKCGIKHTLNSGKLDDPIKAIQEVFDGRKPSTVIDATGVPKVIDQAIDFASPDGRLILLGSPRGEFTGNITHFQQHIHRFPFRVEVVGAHEQMAPAKQMPYVKHSCERNERIALELISEGRLKVKDLITNVVDPKDASMVYSELDKGNPDYLGVIFDWTKY